MEGCVPMAGELPGEVCTQANFQVEPSTIPVGYHSLTLTNPDPAACLTSLPVELQIVAAPTLKGLEPNSVCAGGAVVTLLGEGLVPSSEVFANGEPLAVTWISEGELTLDVSTLAVGSYDIEVQIDGSCSTVMAEALQISDTPLVFFVDPPVIHPTVPTTATAYVADLSGDVAEVWIEDQDGVRSEVSWSAEDAGQVSFQPPNFLDTGPYTVHIAQGGSCEAQTSGEFRVRRYSPIELEELDPAYAWSFDRTAVVITATEQGSPFEATPRAYLMGPEQEGAGEDREISDDEALFKILDRGLRQLDACNSGFRREDAPLHVIFVSDEPERSQEQAASWTYDYWLGEYNKVVPESLLTLSGVVDTEDCNEGDAGYSEAIAATGGLSMSICTTDWAQYAEDIALATLSNAWQFELTEQAASGSIQVQVDGTTSSRWTFNPGSNSVQMNGLQEASEVVITYSVQEECP